MFTDSFVSRRHWTRTVVLLHCFISQRNRQPGSGCRQRKETDKQRPPNSDVTERGLRSGPVCLVVTKGICFCSWCRRGANPWAVRL